MPENNNSLTTRKRRLPQRYYDFGRTLGRATGDYGRNDWKPSEYTSATKRQRAEIEAAVKRLSEKAQFIPDPEAHQDPYVESLRLLAVWNEQGKAEMSEVDKDKDAALLAALAESIGKKAGKIDDEAMRKYIAQSEQQPAAKKDTKKKHKEYDVSLYYAAGIIGYVAGECLSTEEASRTLKVGDPAAAWETDDDTAAVGRVIAADADTFTIRCDSGGEYTFERASCAWAGRVTGTTSPLSDEQQERVERIKKTLENLGDEDDQILRCTARYKLEKELYDIEHPITHADEEDPDDWSAWVEEEA
jgi:hypothetical protein